MKFKNFTIYTFLLLNVASANAQRIDAEDRPMTHSPQSRPTCTQKKQPKNTFWPSFYLGAQGGFMYSGIEWGAKQAEPVELVNILLEDETQRSSSGLISTEKRPTYGHRFAMAEVGFRSSFYQAFAYGGSGKFYSEVNSISRYGLGGGLTLPIGTWFDIFANYQVEYDNSMNGMNLVTLKYDESLSPKKRAAAEKLILHYDDPTGQGAGFVTSQTAQYWSAGARLKKTFFKQRAAIYISGQFLQSMQKPEIESISALTISGGTYFMF